jgi:phosphoribosylformimino-5-aminoimidazole carboxamide ribotide isomerase
VIPAVDIRGGRCVRLRMGLPGEETVFGDDPVEAALRWRRQGARLLHVVDLDGAFAGKPVNGEIILGLITATGMPVEVGGGIRDEKSAFTYLEAGALRVVVGTRALLDPDWVALMAERLGDRLVVGVDARAGKVATEGWTSESELSTSDAVSALAAAGVRRIIYTDISRDGTMEGPNLAGVLEVAQASPVPVIASGGVSRLDDIRKLKEMRDIGVEGVIIGMALYRGEVALGEALAAADGA